MSKRTKRGREQREDDPTTDPPGASGTKRRKTPKSMKRKSSGVPEEPRLPLRLKGKSKKGQDEPLEPGKTTPSGRNQTGPMGPPSLSRPAQTESSETLQGLVEVHNPSQIYQKWLELPIPENKNLRKWPRISFGDHAPTPRWRVVKDNTDPAEGKDVSQDLITTRSGRTIIKGLRPGAVARSFDSSIGLGGLTWKFDPGPAMGWGQLFDNQLYEFAFRCLEAALSNHVAREQFREVIARMPTGDAIAHVEDPLPPLPPGPPKSDFGVFHGLLGVDEVEPPIKQTANFWDSSRRPSLAIREKENVAVAGARKEKNALVERMFFHMAGTIGRSTEISPSYDSDSPASDDSTPPQPRDGDPLPNAHTCPVSLVLVSGKVPTTQTQGQSMPIKVGASAGEGVPDAVPGLEPSQDVEMLDVDPVGEWA